MFTLMQRMEIARARIDALYGEGPHKAEFLILSAQAYGYYADAFRKSNFREGQIVAHYERLACKLVQVKENPFDSEQVARDIEHLTFKKKAAIAVHNMVNLIKIGSLIGITLFLFQFSLVSAVVALATIAVPVLPKIAFALSLCTAYLGYLGFKEGWNSFFDFKSYSHAREETKAERGLCSFFQPANAINNVRETQMLQLESEMDDKNPLMAVHY